MNYLDLIKNPDKINNQNLNQNKIQQQPNGQTPKEAIIPRNLNGALKNEWLEMKRQSESKNDKNNNSSNNKNKDDDVIILDKNPFINNEKSVESKKQSYQKQSDATAALQGQILNKNKKDGNIQSAQQSINQQQQQLPKIYSLPNNQARQFEANNKKLSADPIITQNIVAPPSISKKQSIQFNSSSDKNNNVQLGTNSNQAQQLQQQQQKYQNELIQNNQKLTQRNTLLQQNKNEQNQNRGGVLSSSSSNQSNKMSKQEMLRAKYSLKYQSKEDYKKIFAKIVKEYSDEENQYYDANKTRFSTYIIYTFISILLVMIFFDVLASQTPKFCDTKKVKKDTPNCLMCPENGTCKHYVLRCNEGYIQSGLKCIHNPNLISSSTNFIIETINEMQYKNGYQICFNQAALPENVFATHLNPVSTINNNNNNNDDEMEGNNSIRLDALLQQLTNRVADVKSVESQKQILTKFLEKVENQKQYDFIYDITTKTLSTNRIQFTLFCKTKMFLILNQMLIGLSFVGLLILSYFIVYIKKVLKQNRIATEIYTELYDQILQSTEKQINISYYKEGIVSRYKSDFNEQVWILVDKLRFNEKKINVYRDYDGLYWSQI